MSYTLVNVENKAGLPAEEVDNACRALSIHATHHLAKSWGLAPVSVQPRERTPGDWTLELLGKSDQEGALGYHFWEGKPVLRVFVEDCRQAGISWTACAGHELDEALCDPDVERTYTSGQTERVYALEVGDPAQAFTYEVAGVELQDFVLPAWFRPGAPGPYDWTGDITAPDQVPQGGYAQYIDLRDPSAGWHQVGLDKFAGLSDRPDRS